MSKILVTGGAGFIGSHVTEALIRRGHVVTVLDDLSGGDLRNVPRGVPVVRGNVSDAALVNRLFAEASFDYVYHFAAYAAEGLSHFIKRFNYTNNVIGSVTLVNAAVNTGVRGFVFASSIAVYGSLPVTSMTEASVPQPEDSYGIAKLAVEQEMRVTRDMFGLDFIIFRPHNVYGPRQNIADRYRNVVGIFMNQILHGRPMTIFGDGRQTRAFSYVDDVASVMAEAIDVEAAWNETFNIGADHVCSVIDLAHHVARAMSVKPAIEYLPARLEVTHAHSTHDKVRRIFGDRPETTLDVGLAAMAAWARARGPQATSAFGALEITKNLPEAWRQT